MSGENTADADNQQGRLENKPNVSPQVIENLLRERLEPLREELNREKGRYGAPGTTGSEISFYQAQVNLLEGIAGDLEKQTPGLKLRVGREVEKERRRKK